MRFHCTPDWTVSAVSAAHRTNCLASYLGHVVLWVTKATQRFNSLSKVQANQHGPPASWAEHGTIERSQEQKGVIGTPPRIGVLPVSDIESCIEEGYSRRKHTDEFSESSSEPALEAC